MTHDEILSWLREDDPAKLYRLWRRADEVRRRQVGDEVHLRGLVEISNHCTRLCAYCGLRIANVHLARYRMTEDEILACARQAVALEYGTIVLQSGEDPYLSRAWIEGLVRRIKAETPLAVTLCLGEQSPKNLAAWREAGADRYLLRFETSNRRLYELIHPSAASLDRIALLGVLRGLGYEVGSGAIVGLPGQSHDDLARDIELFASLDLDMIGVGPYVPHPATPLGSERESAVAAQWLKSLELAQDQQVPNNDLMTYKVVALARLVCPRANIPATTALATVNPDEGRELALARGANVVMPILTPLKYRALYEIYPGRVCVAETGEACHRCLSGRIEAIGRRPGRGRGDSRSYQMRRAAGGESASPGAD